MTVNWTNTDVLDSRGRTVRMSNGNCYRLNNNSAGWYLIGESGKFEGMGMLEVRSILNQAEAVLEKGERQ